MPREPLAKHQAMLDHFIRRFADNRMLIGCVFLLLAFDVFVPSMFLFGVNGNGAELFRIAVMTVAVGATMGQLNLIGVWAALAPGRLLIRLPWSFALLIAVWYAMIIGDILMSDHTDLETGTLGVSLLVSFCIIQIPLWFSRRVIGWQLVTVDSNSPSGKNYSISDLMLGTTVLAILLGLGRAILPEETLSPNLDDRPLVVIVSAMIVTNLLVVLPVIWFAFRDTKRFVPWLILVIIASLIEFAGVSLFLGPPGNDWGYVIFAFTIINLTQCGIVYAVMRLMKSSGYNLIRVRSVDASL